MEEHDTLSGASTLDVLSDDAVVGPLVRVAALAHALEVSGAPDPSRAELRDGLAALGAAEPALERVALVVTAHARAAGFTWPEIADAHGCRPDALARRHTRRRERFADYVPPLAPTLEAYTAHAADRLAPTLAERPLSPFLAQLAAERLGAVLLTAHWERVDAVGVASWLGDDALSEPHQRLNHHYSDQAGAVRGVLNAHALDPGPVQASLVELMRKAVGAEDLLRPLHPVHPGPRPAWAVPAATGPDAPAPLPPAAADRDTLRQAQEAGPEGVNAAVAAARWPRATAGPMADLVAAVRLVALHLPADQARPVRALVDAVDAGDGEAMARAVGVLRDLDQAERADLLGDQGQRALDALPVVLPGLRPAPRGLPVRSDAGDRVGNLLDLGEAIRRALPDLAPDATADALGALAEAIDTGAPALLDEPMAAVAALDEDARARALGVPGTRLWERVHRDWSATPAAADGDHPPLAGYGRVLARAGLDPAAATALTGPLTAFAAAAEAVKHRQVAGELRGVLHAVRPVLDGGDPARVRLLLRALPHLNLAGLEEYARLALALAEHAPHLEHSADTAALVETARLSPRLARPLAALVNAARLPVLASFTPAAPASTAAPTLAALIAAVDGAEVSELDVLLDELAHLETLDVVADAPHRLTDLWEEVVYLYTGAAPGHAPAQDSGPDESGLGVDPGQDWADAAAAVIPEQLELATAVARLLAVATPLLGAGELGAGTTHTALDHLRTAVQAGNRATIGTALEAVVGLTPSRAPLKKYPQVVDALRALINTYDHQ